MWQRLSLREELCGSELRSIEKSTCARREAFGIASRERHGTLVSHAPAEHHVGVLGAIAPRVAGRSRNHASAQGRAARVVSNDRSAADSARMAHLRGGPRVRDSSKFRVAHRRADPLEGPRVDVGARGARDRETSAARAAVAVRATGAEAARVREVLADRVAHAADVAGGARRLTRARRARAREEGTSEREPMNSRCCVHP